ncbi:MAG: helix-turn-helix domain-containing protein [Candidatus Didemnitutus sp.]|nr:helix-turn-helix domain-containing protein [Candidatus Didemnitutus sp.]
MPETIPLKVALGPSGVFFAESVHAEQFHMEPRREEFHKLLYLQRGRAALETEGRSAVAASPGTMWIVPAGTTHRLIDEEPTVILLLCVAEALLTRDEEMREVWRALARGGRSALLLGPQAAAETERLWRRVLHEQCLERPGMKAVVKAEALRLLTTLGRIPRRGTADTALSRVDQFLRELEDSFFEPWNLDLAAERSGLSRRHFTLLFKERTGETFVTRLTRLRLQQVERLLSSRRHSVTGAAFAAGFEDLSHFYRIFRQAHGCSPGRWQEKPSEQR